MDLSIVIVSWNARDKLRLCLASLQGHRTRHAFDITVVDNASADGCADLVREEFPAVRLIENSANFGYARANNIGIRGTAGRYVCVMNSDIEVQDGCLDRLIAFMDAHPDTGLCGPKLLNPDSTLQVSWKRFPSLWRNLLAAVGVYRMADDRAARPDAGLATGEVDVLAGAFWVVRREAMDRVGLMDEQFFFYCEDIDWCRRFRDAGWKIVFVAEAEALHHEGSSSAGAPVRFFIEQRRSRLQYWRKHRSPPAVLGIYLIMVLHHLLRLVGGLAALAVPARRSAAAFQVDRNGKCLLWLVGLYRQEDRSQKAEVRSQKPRDESAPSDL